MSKPDDIKGAATGVAGRSLDEPFNLDAGDGGYEFGDELPPGLMAGLDALKAAFTSMPRLDPTEALQRLQSAWALAVKPVTLQIGDLVMVRAGTGFANPGEPSIVVDCYDGPSAEYDFDVGEVGSTAYGVRQDVRILTLGPDNQVGGLWVERWQIEPYAPLTPAGAAN